MFCFLRGVEGKDEMRCIRLERMNDSKDIKMVKGRKECVREKDEQGRAVKRSRRVAPIVQEDSFNRPSLILIFGLPFLRLPASK
jgi:hypothetical protein